MTSDRHGEAAARRDRGATGTGPAVPERARTALRGLALAALALLVYVPAMRSGFIWDDDAFLTANPLIRAPDGLARFWASTEPPDYFPLTSSMLWLEWRLWGADATGYHVVNVALHALACVLLWRVLLRLRVPWAWLGAALFAVHPVAVESVAWITERKNTLPLALGLLALLLHLRAEDEEAQGRGRAALRAGSLVAYLLALLAKTSVVVLAPLLPLCAWWRRGSVRPADLRRAAPYLALAAGLGLVTVWYQGERAIGDLVVRDDGLASRLAIAGRATWFYLGKALFPVELCFLYPRWPTGDVSWRAFGPLALLVATLALAWRARRGRGRAWLFALGCYVTALLPVLGFVDIYFMRYALVADHWQYVALPAVTALAAAGLGGPAARRAPAAARTAAALLLAALAILSWRQQAPYADLPSLWTHTLERNPEAWLAHNNLGGLLLLDGRADEAREHFEAALRHAPPDAGLHGNLGESLLRLRRFEEAEVQFRAGLRLQPERAGLHDSLGLALQGQGRGEEAVAEHRAALRLRPGDAEAHDHLGNALYGLGRLAEAAASYREAVRLRPDYPEAHNNLGNACLGLGRPEEAVAAYESALRDRPDYAEACSNLGSALLQLGRLDEAIARFEQALRLRPDLQGLQDNLREAQRRAGR